MTGLKRGSIFGLVAGLSLAAAATSAESGLARCAAIAEAETRLACYDALAGRAARDKLPKQDRALAALPDPATATRNFGLSAVQQPAVDQGLPAIQAHIIKVVEDQNRRSQLVLDNGQTWAITEGEMLLNSGEAVTIRRAALGSFMLTSVSNHVYRVRRIH